MKTCGKCKEVKILSEFNRRGSKYQSYCRPCQKATYTIYHGTDKEKERLRENSDRIKREIREVIRMAKSVPCGDCGQQYPHYVMDFDHMSDKSFNIAMGAYAVSRQRLLDEIAKCEVVCANCHRERTHNVR